MVQYMRGPTPSAGSVHSTPRRKPLLSRGSLPKYHAEHKPPALRSPPYTEARIAGGWPACVPGCALTQPGLSAVLLAVPAPPGVPLACR